MAVQIQWRVARRRVNISAKRGGNQQLGFTSPLLSLMPISDPFLESYVGLGVVSCLGVLQRGSLSHMTDFLLKHMY